MKIIAVDFDKVLHHYENWEENGIIKGEPIAGSKELLISLDEAGHEIIIFSERANSKFKRGEYQSGQAAEMARWLQFYKIPFDRIYTGEKLHYDVIIDDKSFNPLHHSYKQIEKHINGGIPITPYQEALEEKLVSLHNENNRLKETLKAINNVIDNIKHGIDHEISNKKDYKRKPVEQDFDDECDDEILNLS